MLAIKTPQNYLNQDGVTEKVGQFIAPLAQKVLIVTSPRAWQSVGVSVITSLQRHHISFHISYLPGDCTRTAIDALVVQAQQLGSELILGVGGGRVLDSAKAVGETLGQLPVITLPTIAATCAAWSPISVIYDEAGAHIGPLSLTRLPVWVLVDSQTIARTAPRYLNAGIVDALAKWYEFLPYLRKGDDGLALILKSQVAKQALDTFNTYGQQAIAANQRQEVSVALRKVIDAVIALAGLANSMADDIPRIGIAHAIHNSMTRLPELHHWLHGEKVGFGLVVQSFIEHEQEADRDELLSLLHRFGCPLTLEDLGFKHNDEQVKKIAKGVVIAPHIAARLPFSLAWERIEQALLSTQNLHLEAPYH
ncbi:iron-containing alcohol dehydrogenase family protein [Yersinia sp. 1252 StPb PI]|uniref:iron-containing alcohol dehydrogenase family protein n=1 Tax=unclassified Yersinia (in: enterobacteria) TaxID=2653513 RepID=UPI003B281CCD